MIMKKLIILFLLIVPLVVSSKAQEVPEVNFEELSPWLNKANDTTYVVNFCATWCKPCVEEMPHFLEVATEMKDEKVKFVFVSLDFPTQIESRLLPFIEKHEIREQVVLLNDPNSNEWINKVDAGWSGAIPATLIY
jgi:thiol-disulfide isomerase/thioredoxin